MIQYNLAVEYSMLFIIAVILLSFLHDYGEKSLTNKLIQGVFAVAFGTSVFTLLSMEIDRFIDMPNYTFWAYLVNIMYFAFIPILTTSYLFLCFLISTPKPTKENITKSIIITLTPYTIYLLILLSNIHNNKVFHIDPAIGYVRGDWFQLPFFIAGLNIFFVALIVIFRRKHIHKSTLKAILANMVIAFTQLILQAFFPETIMTGLCNTSSILAFYLFTQNKRKTVDLLTDSKNITALRYDLDELIEKDVDFSLYVLSLRSFKSINERNGLDFGDKVLKAFASELKDFEFINYEILYRYSGDEFAIILEKSDINENNLQSILTYFKKPIEIINLEHVNKSEFVQLDLICARVDNKLFGSSTKELISAVDFSTSLLKQSHGEPRYLYDTAVVKSIIEKTNMIQQIKDAIDNRMFQIYYQPMYSSRDNTFSQAEALVRMKDGKGGIIPPSKFIDIAEITGLIVPMTFVILDIVCEDFRKLIAEHGEDILLKSISVNFPYHFFLTPNIEDVVMETLNKHNLKPNHIKIEITERTFIANEELIKDVMDRMSKLGFVFELDDFGVDYSNMSTFMNLPTQIIKIDRSVLLSAMNNQNNMQFFQHLIIGISATGRIIVVEGVEEKEQLDFILSCECEYVQGYIFSKPLQYDDFSRFILPTAVKDLLSSFDL